MIDQKKEYILYSHNCFPIHNHMKRIYTWISTGGGKFMPSNSGKGILLFITSADNDKLKIFCDWKERVVEKCIVWVILCLFFLNAGRSSTSINLCLHTLKSSWTIIIIFILVSICFAGVIREYKIYGALIFVLGLYTLIWSINAFIGIELIIIDIFLVAIITWWNTYFISYISF